MIEATKNWFLTHNFDPMNVDNLVDAVIGQQSFCGWEGLHDSLIVDLGLDKQHADDLVLTMREAERRAN